MSTASHLRHNTAWLRDDRNPVLPPAEPGFDSRLCMNPWVMRDGDHYQLYYAGEGADGDRRICLATAPVTDVGSWQRHGPQFARGGPDDFDAAWCVLPNVVDAGPGRRRIYYTGNSGRGRSLERFGGLGLAESVDGQPYVRNNHNPVITPSRVPGDPDACGVAGGSVVRVPGQDPEWRYYYTGCPTVGDDVFLDQQKTVCLATSADGIEWHRHGAVLLRRPDTDYEDIAVAGPVVRRHPSGTYQMWYSAIGTRWGFYSICYAESDDGITWSRGVRYGDNLQLGPTAAPDPGWCSQMVAYPTVVDEDERVRMFFAGNGYGRAGIGTATSTPLRATAAGAGLLRVVCSRTGADWLIEATTEVDGERVGARGLSWHGPDADVGLWSEVRLRPGLAVRRTVTHTADGIDLHTTVVNDSGSTHPVGTGWVPADRAATGLRIGPATATTCPPGTSIRTGTAVALDG